MPASPSQSPLQPAPIQTTQDGPPVAEETPQPAQPGALSGSAASTRLQPSATLESLLDALDRGIMTETAVPNVPPSPTIARAANNHAQASSGRRHVRPVFPDPVAAAPNVPRAAVAQPNRAGNQQRLSIAGRILVFFGYGRNNKARKELVSVISSVIVDLSQIIAIITLLTISTHRRSPIVPDKNEWDACGKPLGTWDALWVVRLALDVWLSIWRWSRERTKRLQDESNDQAPNDAETHPRNRASGATPSGRAHGRASQRNPNTSSEGQSQAALAPYPRIYARLSLMGSTFTLVWFVLVQILLYSSANTCRQASPHLWWLTFGVLSVMYVMILEVVVVAILVFVVGPILFLFWSILLLCLGRHPSQNPHHFTPDIGQVPRAVVDKLPLVLYIPPPPDQPSKPVTFPLDLHAYPPKSPTSRRRLRFLPFGRRAASPGNIIKSSTGKGKRDPNRPLTWEDHWEKGEYPFVQLDSHRASCAICLLDFQAPRRVGVGAQGSDVTNAGAQNQTHMEGAENQATGEPVTQQESEADVTEQTAALALLGDDLTLRLQDAGQGVQPLRLLKCGHVFHKTCVDPWLLDVSGRCPVCQRPVREQADMTGTEQEARPARRRWFRRSRRRGPV